MFQSAKLQDNDASPLANLLIDKLLNETYFFSLLNTKRVIKIPVESLLPALLSTPLVTKASSQPSSLIVFNLEVIRASLAAMF